MKKKVREILSKYRQNEGYTMEHAERELLDLFSVSPRLFYVVTHSQYTEGSWEQISNGFDTYEEAVKYRDDNFCKTRYPNAFIVASLNEG
jgi:hypothetical protein